MANFKMSNQDWCRIELWSRGAGLRIQKQTDALMANSFYTKLLRPFSGGQNSLTQIVLG